MKRDCTRDEKELYTRLKGTVHAMKRDCTRDEKLPVMKYTCFALSKLNVFNKVFNNIDLQISATYTTKDHVRIKHCLVKNMTMSFTILVRYPGGI